MNQWLQYFRTAYGIEKPTDITWANAVNSQQKLRAALADTSRMMIDADITKSPEGVAICAHWPDTTSDLSFDELVQAVQCSQQGLKLDFKDSDIVVDCLQTLRLAQLPQAVILNADILSLAHAPAPDFDGKQFLQACTHYYPAALISVGWRTEDDPTHPYTLQDINNMLGLVQGIDAVTFPIRATLLPHSWPQVQKLLSNEHHSLLLWNSGPIDAQLWQWIQKHIDPRRAFYQLN